ncbi:MAG: hypothetical protein ABIQ88_04180 [Chitinophagaceae bacterium]
MKNFLLLVVLSVTVFAACKKTVADPVATDPIVLSVDGATVTRSGQLVFSSKDEAGGSVTIYKQKNGRYILGLEQMSFSSPFDMNVYLSATPGLTTASIKLFSAKNFTGNMYYALPAGINIDAFKYFMLQNDTAEQPAASAMLTQ